MILANYNQRLVISGWLVVCLPNCFSESLTERLISKAQVVTQAKLEQIIVTKSAPDTRYSQFVCGGLLLPEQRKVIAEFPIVKTTKLLSWVPIDGRPKESTWYYIQLN